MRKIWLLLLLTNFLLAIDAFQSCNSICWFQLFTIASLFIVFPLWFFAFLLSPKGGELFHKIFLVNIAVIVLLFLLDTIINYIDDQNSKPRHYFVSKEYYSQDLKKSKVEELQDDKIIDLDILEGYWRPKIGYLTKSGKLVCSNPKDRTVVLFTKRVPAMASCNAEATTITLLYPKEKNAHIYTLQNRHNQESKKYRVFEEGYKYENRLTPLPSEQKRLFIDHINSIHLIDTSLSVAVIKKDTNRIELYNNRVKINSFKMPKEPKLALYHDLYKRIYVVFDDEENIIYRYDIGEDKEFKKAQESVKSVINRAFQPWWSFKSSSIKGISSDDIKKIAKLYNNKKWYQAPIHQSFLYSIKKIKEHLFSVEVVSSKKPEMKMIFIVEQNSDKSKIVSFKIVENFNFFIEPLLSKHSSNNLLVHYMNLYAEAFSDLLSDNFQDKNSTLAVAKIASSCLQKISQKNLIKEALETIQREKIKTIQHQIESFDNPLVEWIVDLGVCKESSDKIFLEQLYNKSYFYPIAISAINNHKAIILDKTTSKLFEYDLIKKELIKSVGELNSSSSSNLIAVPKSLQRAQKIFTQFYEKRLILAKNNLLLTIQPSSSITLYKKFKNRYKKVTSLQIAGLIYYGVYFINDTLVSVPTYRYGQTILNTQNLKGIACGLIALDATSIDGNSFYIINKKRELELINFNKQAVVKKFDEEKLLRIKYDKKRKILYLIKKNQLLEYDVSNIQNIKLIKKVKFSVDYINLKFFEDYIAYYDFFKKYFVIYDKTSKKVIKFPWKGNRLEEIRDYIIVNNKIFIASGYKGIKVINLKEFK